ncbi:MAG: YihY/virulence factor BrkB family protein [Vicinamibacteraceae bacterium]
MTWRDLAVKTYREVLDDDVLGLAAQLSYYFFLALFPALLFGLALASFFPLGALTDDVSAVLGPVVSPEILSLIQDQMKRLANAESGGLLTFGVVGALWSSSAAVVSIVDALNRAYDITESRPWWKVRLTAIGLTLGLAVFMLAALTLVLAGPSMATYLDDRVGLGDAFRWGWLVLQWPVAILLTACALGLVFYFGPDAEQDWAWITPGALVGSVLWLLVSLATKVYVANFTDYNASYGAVGGVMVVMLWLYVSSIAILIAAELNAEIEHGSPHGKAPGQKSKTGRRVLGPRASRMFEARPPEAPVEASSPHVTALPSTASGAAVGAVLAAVILGIRACTAASATEPDPPEPPTSGGMIPQG